MRLVLFKYSKHGALVFNMLSTCLFLLASVCRQAMKTGCTIWRLNVGRNTQSSHHTSDSWQRSTWMACTPPAVWYVNLRASGVSTVLEIDDKTLDLFFLQHSWIHVENELGPCIFFFITSKFKLRMNSSRACTQFGGLCMQHDTCKHIRVFR